MKEGCAMGGTDMASGAHAGHSGAPIAGVPQSPASRAVFMPPVQSVYDGYIQVQRALAEDSLEGISGTAVAMVKAIQGDSAKMLPAKLGQEVEALSKAKDLEAARAAFKPLSASLIQYLKDQKGPSGTYHEVYCPMAKASWLQTAKTIMNPYMGKEMIHCGEFKS
jgi:Cu(I)/Ag(I) efflux system membrane fusion protein